MTLRHSVHVLSAVVESDPGRPLGGEAAALELTRTDSSAPPPADGPISARSRARLDDLVRQHYRFVWRVLRRLGLPPAAADDGAQHVFLVAAGRVHDIAEGAEQAFLYRTAALTAHTRRRQHARRAESGDDPHLEIAADPGPTPEDLAEKKRARAVLDALLDELDDDLREVFVLFELQGLTVDAMAELLAIPRGTCGSRLKRAREVFAVALKRHQAKQASGGRK